VSSGLLPPHSLLPCGPRTEEEECSVCPKILSITSLQTVGYIFSIHHSVQTLAPSNFHFCGPLKKHLKGKNFYHDDEIWKPRYVNVCANAEPLFLLHRHHMWCITGTSGLFIMPSGLEHTEVINTVKIVVFWDVTLYSFVVRGTCCLHLQDWSVKVSE
jgi:hypothetical protein